METIPPLQVLPSPVSPACPRRDLQSKHLLHQGSMELGGEMRQCHAHTAEFLWSSGKKPERPKSSWV